MERAGPLVDFDWLRARLADPGVRLVDCRWRLGEPGAGEPLYVEGHLPGAAFLDVDRDLSAAPGRAARHPLPGPGDFETAARAAGLRADSFVVAYDESGEGGAARLWWLLRHFGHDAAAVLDGGLGTWRERRGPLRTGPERTEPGDFVARPRSDDTVAAEEILRDLEVAGRGAGRPRLSLLDARVPERYRGEREPLDPVAGHIPGAANLPYVELAPSGRFLERAELGRRLQAATGEGESVAYCGSGVTACTLVLAAAAAGAAAPRLYPGSWSEWSGRGYPAARQ